MGNAGNHRMLSNFLEGVLNHGSRSKQDQEPTSFNEAPARESVGRTISN